jgi:hypothetical protein
VRVGEGRGGEGCGGGGKGGPHDIHAQLAEDVLVLLAGGLLAREGDAGGELHLALVDVLVVAGDEAARVLDGRRARVALIVGHGGLRKGWWGEAARQGGERGARGNR